PDGGQSGGGGARDGTGRRHRRRSRSVPGGIDSGGRTGGFAPARGLGGLPAPGADSGFGARGDSGFPGARGRGSIGRRRPVGPARFIRWPHGPCSRPPAGGAAGCAGAVAMSFGRGSRVGFALVMLALLVLQFYLRPRIWDSRIAPDFLVIALLIIAMGSRPGTGAIAGLIIGLVSDALTPARVGAGMLAYTIVGYVASWGRAVF